MATENSDHPATPSRLLFLITSTGTGGTESVLRELVPRLDRQAFRPTVCSLRPLGSVGYDLLQQGVPVFSLGASEKPRLFDILRSIFSLIDLIEKAEIDLIHSFLYRANVLGSIAGSLARRKPVVVTSQRSLDPLTGRTAVLAARLTRRLSDRVVAVSRAVEQHLTERGGEVHDRVVVIGNGVDASRYHPCRAERRTFQNRSVAEDLIIGAAGRLTEVKGLDSLIRAVGLLAPTVPSIRLRIAGDGPERQSLENLARDLEIVDRVQFVGELQQMETFYGELDLFVLPSLREGSPNVLLEAMACGCPVIATRVGGVPEIIEDERSGFLVEPRDPQALAVAIERLVRFPNLLRTASEHGRQRIEERFTVEQMVQRYQQLYTLLLSADC